MVLRRLTKIIQRMKKKRVEWKKKGLTNVICMTRMNTTRISALASIRTIGPNSKLTFEFFVQLPTNRSLVENTHPKCLDRTVNVSNLGLAWSIKVNAYDVQIGQERKRNRCDELKHKCNEKDDGPYGAYFNCAVHRRERQRERNVRGEEAGKERRTEKGCIVALWDMRIVVRYVTQAWLVTIVNGDDVRLPSLVVVSATSNSSESLLVQLS